MIYARQTWHAVIKVWEWPILFESPCRSHIRGDEQGGVASEDALTRGDYAEPDGGETASRGVIWGLWLR